MASIPAFQAVGLGSNPSRRSNYFIGIYLEPPRGLNPSETGSKKMRPDGGELRSGFLRAEWKLLSIYESSGYITNKVKNTSVTRGVKP